MKTSEIEYVKGKKYNFTIKNNKSGEVKVWRNLEFLQIIPAKETIQPEMLMAIEPDFLEYNLNQILSKIPESKEDRLHDALMKLSERIVRNLTQNHNRFIFIKPDDSLRCLYSGQSFLDIKEI